MPKSIKDCTFASGEDLLILRVDVILLLATMNDNVTCFHNPFGYTFRILSCKVA